MPDPRGLQVLSLVKKFQTSVVLYTSVQYIIFSAIFFQTNIEMELSITLDGSVSKYARQNMFSRKKETHL